MHESHGNSVAAWTGTIIILLGCVLVSLGIMFSQHPLLWIVGIALIVVGFVAWVVLARIGYGEKQHEPAAGQPEANGVR